MSLPKNSNTYSEMKICVEVSLASDDFTTKHIASKYSILNKYEYSLSVVIRSWLNPAVSQNPGVSTTRRLYPMKGSVST